MIKNDFFDVLDAWYTTLNKNFDALVKAYPAPLGNDCREEMDTFYKFSQKSKIGYTPAILLDRRMLTESYSYQDLHGITRVLNAES